MHWRCRQVLLVTAVAVAAGKLLLGIVVNAEECHIAACINARALNNTEVCTEPMVLTADCLASRTCSVPPCLVNIPLDEKQRCLCLFGL